MVNRAVHIVVWWGTTLGTLSVVGGKALLVFGDAHLSEHFLWLTVKHYWCLVKPCIRSNFCGSWQSYAVHTVVWRGTPLATLCVTGGKATLLSGEALHWEHLLWLVAKPCCSYRCLVRHYLRSIYCGWW